MNKTLCFADENRAKGDLTPYEFYGKQGEQKWNDIKLQALSCFKNKAHYPNAYYKFKQFVKQKHDSDFISRQLNDTRYISKEAKNYLSKICNNVMVAPGQMTSNLRHHWGLNTVLNKEEDVKIREDHRHHAIDALVMACATRSHLQELSKWNRYDRTYDLDNFPKPWKTFREDAVKAVNQILVSHKKTKSILTVRTHTTNKNGEKYKNVGVAARGQLHKETIFGKRQTPHSDQGFHVRKPIDSLTTEKQLEKVVDKTIKDLIFKRIHILGGFVKGKIPVETFFISDERGKKLPQIFLPNKNGNSVPVLKVRMRENIGGAEKLKNNLNQWVNPRNNHHVLIFRDENENLKEEVVTFWTVVERKRKGFPVYQLPAHGQSIVTTLQINDMFLLGLNEDEVDWGNLNYNILKKYLYRVQKLTSGDYFFRKHTSSTITDENYKQIRGFGMGKTGWFAFNPIKVKISVTGKILKI